MVLLGRMGKAPPILDRTIHQVVKSPMIGHSIKPQEIRRLINKMYGTKIPKIELFARIIEPGDKSGRELTKYAEGWHFHGDNDYGDEKVSRKMSRRNSNSSKASNQSDDTDEEESKNQTDTDNEEVDSDSELSRSSFGTKGRSRRRNSTSSTGENRKKNYTRRRRASSSS